MIKKIIYLFIILTFLSIAYLALKSENHITTEESSLFNLKHESNTEKETTKNNVLEVEKPPFIK